MSASPIITNETRRAAIREAIKNSNTRENFIFNSNTFSDCPVIVINIDYPYYRLGNTRTKSYQKSYLSENTHLPDDFFSDENEVLDEQQKIQDTLLRKDLDKKQRELLMDSFDKYNGQNEPLIMTNKGIIVNGNRRLCFMRGINQSVVKVLILPDALNNQLHRVEAFLDYNVTTKVDYDWRAKGQVYYEMHNGISDGKNWTYEDIAEHLFVNPKEVEKTANRYYLASENLRIRGLENQFDLLDKSGQLHIDCNAEWYKKGSGLQSRHQQIALSALILLDSSPETEGRKYGSYKKWMKYPEIVETVISENIKIPDNLEDKFGDGDNISIFSAESLTSLRGEDGTFNSNQEKVDEIVDRIIEEVSDKEEEDADLETTKRFLKLLKEAEANLKTAFNNLHEGSDLDDYQNIKEQIESRLEKIDEQIKILGS